MSAGLEIGRAPSLADAGLASLPRTQSLASGAKSRLALLDWLRVIGANLIVWHHLAFYGPLSDGAHSMMPILMDFLNGEARYAVQLFLVMGGFVAAAGLGQREITSFAAAWRIIRQRYFRIAGPYWMVLILAVGANWLASQWMDHDSISSHPTIPQLLAHSVLLHDVLGYEALTAGIWYLAIDFQLMLLVVILMASAHQLSRLTGYSSQLLLNVLLLTLAMASLFWFNRDPHWEPWAIYFFGSYALGLLTAWVLAGRLPKWTAWLYIVLFVAALAVEWRTRLIVTLLTGMILLWSGRQGWLYRWSSGPWLSFAGQCSFSLFLVHFPVCLVVNAFFLPWIQDSPTGCLLGMIVAYTLSAAVAVVFYFGVERTYSALFRPARMETR